MYKFIRVRVLNVSTTPIIAKLVLLLFVFHAVLEVWQTTGNIDSTNAPRESGVNIHLPHMPSSSQIQWASYKKWKVEWETRTEMCRWSTSTSENSCGCPALDMPEWRETTEQIDCMAVKATLTSGLLFGRSEVLRSLRHYLRAQSQGHHTTDRLEDRGIERGSSSRSSLKGRERAIDSQTNIGTV